MIRRKFLLAILSIIISYSELSSGKDENENIEEAFSKAISSSKSRETKINNENVSKMPHSHNIPPDRTVGVAGNGTRTIEHFDKLGIRGDGEKDIFSLLDLTFKTNKSSAGESQKNLTRDDEIINIVSFNNASSAANQLPVSTQMNNKALTTGSYSVVSFATEAEETPVNVTTQNKTIIEFEHEEIEIDSHHPKNKILTPNLNVTVNYELTTDATVLTTKKQVVLAESDLENYGQSINMNNSANDESFQSIITTVKYTTEDIDLNFHPASTIQDSTASLGSNINLSNSSVIISKCCKETEFFSSEAVQCKSLMDPSNFYTTIESISEGFNKEVLFSTGPLLACPNDGNPPQIDSSLSVATHVLLRTGEVFDMYLQQVYSPSEYCLEQVGVDQKTSSLTLAYCPKAIDYSYYYDYPTEDHIDELRVDNAESVTLRKCCRDGEYYDSNFHKCKDDARALDFHHHVQHLISENATSHLNIIPSRIKECPNGVGNPTTKKVIENSYKLKNNGDLIDTLTGIRYGISHYCLELVGVEPENLSFTIAICPKTYNVLPKCCPQNHYFHENNTDCESIPAERKFKENLLQTLELDTDLYSLEPLSYFFSCQDASPSQAYSDSFSFKGGELCIDEYCYPNSDFCVDFSLFSPADNFRGMTFFCQTNYYIKCCPEGQILEENGCRNYAGGKSLLSKQLIRTKNIIRSFDYKMCKGENAVLLDEASTSYIQWWLGDDGRHLVVESSFNTKFIRQYCIDDFIGHDEKVQPVAYVCEDDVKNMLPLKTDIHKYRESGSFGKCCPINTKENTVFYYSIQDKKCQTIESNLTLTQDEAFINAGLSQSHFHDFPNCHNLLAGYHSYPLINGSTDHAIPSTEGHLTVVGVEGKCHKTEKDVAYEDFCFEYVLTADGKLESAAFVCAVDTVLDIYNEKFDLLIALLAISCICLFVTLVSLFTMKVRRGVLLIRKVNTLAGKILVSFVAAHLLGYFSLLMAQHENFLNKSGTVGCYILSGMIQFFILATFCWNTSICLESFLLTIHIKISECLRYFLHCLWAWGFPALLTLVVILVDMYEDDIPCGTIRPNIAVYRCFLSDDGRLVYFYAPMFVMLVANIVFLLGSKSLRTSRLRRLEKGPKAPKGSGAGTPAQVGKPASSGMRTHQTQNTKVEYIKIVLWTGGIWFFELLGFLTTKYMTPPAGERWYGYLWYIPTSLNALRGVGIFAIIVLTPETRDRIKKSIQTANSSLLTKIGPILPFKIGKKKPKSRSNGVNSTFLESMKTRRRTSITTMITSISASINASIRKTGTSRRISVASNGAASVNGEEPEQRKLSKARSISIILQRGLGLASGDDQGLELETEFPRRSSLQDSTSPTLPKLPEEDAVDNFDLCKVDNVTVSTSEV